MSDKEIKLLKRVGERKQPLLEVTNYGTIKGNSKFKEVGIDAFINELEQKVSENICIAWQSVMCAYSVSTIPICYVVYEQCVYWIATCFLQ